MVEEYEEIADSQYLSERLEYLDEDYGKSLTNRRDEHEFKVPHQVEPPTCATHETTDDLDLKLQLGDQMLVNQ